MRRRLKSSILFFLFYVQIEVYHQLIILKQVGDIHSLTRSTLFIDISAAAYILTIQRTYSVNETIISSFPCISKEGDIRAYEIENPTAPALISLFLRAKTQAKIVTNDPVKFEKLCSTRLVCHRYQKHLVFWSNSRKILRMNRAESPYDRIVDIPTSASENDMNKGERVVLCSLVCDEIRVQRRWV